MLESIENVCEVVAPLALEVWWSREPLPFARRFEGEYRKLKIGERWGGLFDCGWFRFRGAVPEGMAPGELALRIDINGEGLAVDASGRPLRGLTNVASVFDRELGTPEKVFLPLSEFGVAAGEFEVWMDAGCNDLFGELQGEGRIRFAELVRRTPASVDAYYDRRCPRETLPEDGADDYTLVAVGHAHMDLAWLWPVRETRRKGVRTFATALTQMARYPWYVFGASQPQLYRWIEEDAPELWSEVRRREAEGRWELQGAAWVEHDTHLPDGESLMRQYIYGQHYWRSRFGHPVDTVWLPDVFGYSANLPQIARLNGATHVVTMKNAWNRFHPFPYCSFRWRGIDGTTVLTVRLPEETYNGAATPESLRKARANDRERVVTRTGLVLYGVGDGGGGPGEAHLEQLARCRTQPELPELEFAPSKHFFDRLESVAAQLPQYDGELYLENHQGTFTTCETVKRINRMWERLRQEIEFAAVAFGRALPQDWTEFEQELLLTQFHDVLPGSSIRRVYDELEQRFHGWSERLRRYRGAPSPQMFFNPTASPTVQYRNIGGAWFRIAPPCLGWAAPQPVTEFPAVAADAANRLRNEAVTVEFAADGALARMTVDGRDRLHAPARLAIYADTGNAWNIEPECYAGTPEFPVCMAAHCHADGPVASCTQLWQWRESRIELEYRLAAGWRHLECRMRIDWRNPEHLLRLEIPSALAAPEAEYATQYGFRRYPTGDADSHDRARYEVAAQRWVRVEADGMDLVLASDIKYGYSVKGAQLNLTLLRAPVRPGPFIGRDDAGRRDEPGDAARYNDLGAHDFGWALGVADGDVAKAYDLAEWVNRELPATPEGVATPGRWLESLPPELGVSCVRPNFGGSGTLLRVYERRGRTTSWQDMPAHARFTTPDGGTTVSTTAEFHPFEIKTLVL